MQTQSPNSSDSLLRVSSKKQVRLGEKLGATESSASSDGEELEDEPKRQVATTTSISALLDLDSGHIRGNADPTGKQSSTLAPIIESPDPKMPSCPPATSCSSTTTTTTLEPHSNLTANRIQIRVIDFEANSAVWNEFVSEWEQHEQFSFLFIPAPGSMLATHFTHALKDDGGEPLDSAETNGIRTLVLFLFPYHYAVYVLYPYF